MGITDCQAISSPSSACRSMQSRFQSCRSCNTRLLQRGHLQRLPLRRKLSRRPVAARADGPTVWQTRRKSELAAQNVAHPKTTYSKLRDCAVLFRSSSWLPVHLVEVVPALSRAHSHKSGISFQACRLWIAATRGALLASNTYGAHTSLTSQMLQSVNAPYRPGTQTRLRFLVPEVLHGQADRLGTAV